MTDHPMIFSTPMVLALLDGRKTQTRRILGPGNTLFDGGPWSALHKRQALDWNGARVGLGPSPAGNSGPYIRLCGEEGMVHRIYPRVQPGDRLWVKEAWRSHQAYDDIKPSEMGGEEPVGYIADRTWQTWGWPSVDIPGRYRNARFMPRWASRLTLTVSEVRVQQVQDISEADAVAEGIDRLVGSNGPNHFSRQICGKWSGSFNAPTARDVYADLWNTLHGPDAWDQNDWVVAYTFTVQRGNIDQVKS